MLGCKTTEILQKFLFIPKFQSFERVSNSLVCEITQVRAAPPSGSSPCSRKMGEFFVPAAVQTLRACCLPCSENKSRPLRWSHVPTEPLPSVPVLAGLFPFPAHTEQIPPPAPGALQKGSCAWGNVPGTSGTCICSLL